jgi:hypothetical protein
MAMYGLFLETGRCPDGVELIEIGRPAQRHTFPGSKTSRATLGPMEFYSPAKPPRLHFRLRTDRTDPLRLEMNLENPVAVEFANARDDDDRIKFYSKFGLLFESQWYERAEEYDNVLENQKKIRDWLLNGANPIDIFRDTPDWPGGLGLKPTFDLGGEAGAPRMLLKCESLIDFMVMEVAMITFHGAKVGTCQHCGAIFLTGSLTGRRSHAKYCSDRCRVAAMRARNRAHVEGGANVDS